MKRKAPESDLTIFKKGKRTIDDYMNEIKRKIEALPDITIENWLEIYSDASAGYKTRIEKPNAITLSDIIEAYISILDNYKELEFWTAYGATSEKVKNELNIILTHCDTIIYDITQASRERLKDQESFFNDFIHNGNLSRIAKELLKRVLGIFM